MEAYRGKVLRYEELERYTNNFSEDNFIGKFQFGRVYRGEIRAADENGSEARNVTVKIWENPKIYQIRHPEDNEERLKEEVHMLKHMVIESHPQMATLYGYCSEGEHVGIVYDFKPLDTVHNLILKDSFTWEERVKVALHFACLIEYFHAPREPYRAFLIRNVAAAHIMLDQDRNMKLFDFSMIAGGIFFERRDDTGLIRGCYGYIDPAFASAGDCWSEKNDVFAFGVLLLELIAKRVFDTEETRKNPSLPYVHQWAKKEYKVRKSNIGFFAESKISLVHPSFEVDPDFYSSDGPKITKLAMQCVKYFPHQRPTMRQVVDQLLNLHVVQHHVDRLGFGQLIHGRDPYQFKDKPLEVINALFHLRRKENLLGPTNYGEGSGHELIQAQAHVWNHVLKFIDLMSLKCAIQLGIFDIIHNHGQPMTLSDLVSALPSICPTKTQSIFRLMRVLIHSDFVVLKKLHDINGEGEGYFLTPASKLLLKYEPFKASLLLMAALDPV